MEIVFDTLNSRYYVNTAAMTWKRDKTPRSGYLMDIEQGPLYQIPDIITGERCFLVEGPQGYLGTISTSQIKTIISIRAL